MGNQKPQIDEEHTIQWESEKGTKTIYKPLTEDKIDQQERH